MTKLTEKEILTVLRLLQAEKTKLVNHIEAFGEFSEEENKYNDATQKLLNETDVLSSIIEKMYKSIK